MTPFKDCKLVPPKTNGFFVRLYLCAESGEDAIGKIQTWAVIKQMNVKNIEWCVDLEQVVWENEANLQAIAFANKARRSGVIELGDLHSW